TGQRGLALRPRDRGREARPADQQLPPPARRRHVRPVPAPAHRVALEELPDDGARRDRRGQDQVRIQEVSHRRWAEGAVSSLASGGFYLTVKKPNIVDSWMEQ